MKCSLCTRVIATHSLCQSCTERVTGYLQTISVLWPDLEITLARLGRVHGRQYQRITPENAALPFRPETAVVANQIRDRLIQWARIVSADTRIMLPPKHDPRILARWLSGRIAHWDMGNYAGPFFRDLSRMRAMIVRAIDLPVETVSLGPCPSCFMPRFVDQERTAVYRCACGLVVAVSEALAARQLRLENVLVTWPDLVALSGIPRRTLQRWRQTGRLQPAEIIESEPYWRCLDAVKLVQKYH